MDVYTATELAYKNGYKAGYADGVEAARQEFESELKRCVDSFVNMHDVKVDNGWELVSTNSPMEGQMKLDG